MKQLITLEEFIKSRLVSIGNAPVPNGIECPVCKKELYDSNPNLTLTSYPPQKSIHCEGCGFVGYRPA